MSFRERRAIDTEEIDKGADYQELYQCYVIFICQTDIFHKGRHKYTFRNLCVEDVGMELGDHTCKVFLNAGGTMDDISPNLKVVLDYVAGKMSDDPYVKELDAAVTEAKHNREWRREYMTLEMKYKEKYNEGRKAGLEQGLEQGLSLNFKGRKTKGNSGNGIRVKGSEYCGGCDSKKAGRKIWIERRTG